MSGIVVQWLVDPRHTPTGRALAEAVRGMLAHFGQADDAPRPPREAKVRLGSSRRRHRLARAGSISARARSTAGMIDGAWRGSTAQWLSITPCFPRLPDGSWDRTYLLPCFTRRAQAQEVPEADYAGDQPDPRRKGGQRGGLVDHLGSAECIADPTYP
jgi:hypothetical protein